MSQNATSQGPQRTQRPQNLRLRVNFARLDGLSLGAPFSGLGGLVEESGASANVASQGRFASHIATALRNLLGTRVPQSGDGGAEDTGGSRTVGNVESGRSGLNSASSAGSGPTDTGSSSENADDEDTGASSAPPFIPHLADSPMLRHIMENHQSDIVAAISANLAQARAQSAAAAAAGGVASDGAGARANGSRPPGSFPLPSGPLPGLPSGLPSGVDWMGGFTLEFTQAQDAGTRAGPGPASRPPAAEAMLRRLVVVEFNRQEQLDRLKECTSVCSVCLDK